MTVAYTEPSLDSCKFEPDHQYYITLPDHLNADQKLPLLIVLDPHGDGFLAVQKFRDALTGPAGCHCRFKQDQE